MLQKFEADVRQHIRIEQQLKLHIETIQEKLEEDEKVIEKYKLEKVSFNLLYFTLTRFNHFCRAFIKNGTNEKWPGWTKS